MNEAVMPAEMASRDLDERAFSALLEPVLEPGYRLACAMLHDPQAAEDAVQEAALKAWRKLHRLRPGASMRPWFLGIVANECRNTRRSRWWSMTTSALADRVVEARADKVLTAVEVRRALRALEYRSRLVLVLRWYLDLPVEEIARATGLSQHAVESRLTRATKELRQRLRHLEVLDA